VIDAVLFDLDDTLYPQSSWLDGAWGAVALAAPESVNRAVLHNALRAIAAEGTDRGHIIDRALLVAGAPDIDPTPLVTAFRAHAPARMETYPGTTEVLRGLREHVPVGLVSDGDVRCQAAKLRALDLTDAFDVIVWSDALGREFRKPHPAPFRTALDRLGANGLRCVMVGDRPEKDTRGARAAGLLGCIRVRTGEYATHPDEVGCLASVDSVREAGAWVLALMDGLGRQLSDQRQP
jgi:putative hydrolase of the HAD superfamily